MLAYAQYTFLPKKIEIKGYDYFSLTYYENRVMVAMVVAVVLVAILVVILVIIPIVTLAKKELTIKISELVNY